MRRALLVTLIIGASVLIARGPIIRPSFTLAALAGARETTAYRLDATGTRFPLSEGTRRLRILTNLDLAPDGGAEGLGFSLRVRIPEEPYDETFALVGMPRSRPDGAPAVFSVGEPTSPAWTREIALERTQSTAATLELSLVEPGGGRASVRVLTEAERAPMAAEVLARRSGPNERNHLASSLGPLDWDQLPEELQADLLARHWARIPASPGSATRRLYVAGAPAPLPKVEAPEGEVVEPGQVAAYTAQGPGTLRLFAAGAPVTGTVERLQADGQLRAQPLNLKAGERLDLALGSQLTTARVRVEQPSRVMAVISDKRLAIATARLEPRADGEWVLHPAVALERTPRAEPEPAPPVVYDLRGRDSSVLHLTARLKARPDQQPMTAHVRWTMRDEQRRVVASGALTETLPPALEDRIDDEPGAVPSEPATAYLWPPPSASTLELTADPPALIAVDSPGFAPPVEQPLDTGVEGATSLRHAPRERPLWFRVRPSNEDELLASGRIQPLRSPVRLERAAPHPPPALRAETLDPLQKPARFTVLVPAKPDGQRPGLWWPLPEGVTSKVRFDRPPGASPGARVPWNLLYLGDASRSAREAAIRIDSGDATRATLFTTRGTLALAPTTPGVHLVSVTLAAKRAHSPPMARLFVDRPTGSPTPFRSFRVFPLRPGARTAIRLRKTAQPRSLGAVLYFDAAPGANASLVVTVDGGQRTVPVTRFSRLRSRLTRVLPIHAQPLQGASYLDRSTVGVWGSTPLFVGLADDLPAGDHLIAVALKGTKARAFARFFSYGGPQSRAERFSTFGEFSSVP